MSSYLIFDTEYPGNFLLCGHCTGQLLLAKGEVEQAFAAFKIVLDGDQDNVPALLGQV